MKDINKTIMLDLDGTLKTDYDNNISLSKNPLIVVHENVTYRFLKRPYVNELLEYAKQNFNLCLGTFGKIDYAYDVLNKLNIVKYFDKIYTLENFEGKINDINNFILIDNSKQMAEAKISSIKSNGERFIWEIKTYMGNEDDIEMLKLIKKLEILKKRGSK